jgi:hypothetical protein
VTERPSRKKGSMPAAVLGGALLGLRDVLEPPKEEATFEVVDEGEPPDPGWVDVKLDPVHPEDTEVTVNPDLAPDRDAEQRGAAPGPGPAAGRRG